LAIIPGNRAAFTIGDVPADDRRRPPTTDDDRRRPTTTDDDRRRPPTTDDNRRQPTTTTPAPQRRGPTAGTLTGGTAAASTARPTGLAKEQLMHSLKQRLARGETTVILGVGRVLHYNLLQMVGLMGGYQGIWFDMEHVGLTTEQLEVAALACRAHGLDSFCRLAPTDYASVTRCLEAGVGGVMAAQISSAQQAEEFVRWAKFAPRGCRGLNTGGWDARFTTIPAGQFCRQANAETFVLIQIETLGAVEDCEAIAAIDGVDGLFIGPSDLSQSLGVTGEFFHDKCIAAIERVAAACRKHGKGLAAVTFSPQHAQMLYDRGCRVFSPSNDVRVILAGLQAVQKDFGFLFAAAGRDSGER